MRSASAVRHQTSNSAKPAPASAEAGTTIASVTPAAYRIAASGPSIVASMPTRIG
jgi:hypothetical protein